MKPIYFYGLTKIRAIASLSVLVHHIELYKHRDGLPSLFDTFFYYFIKNLGKNGVHLFFILSGFLITYLILEERRVFGKIDVRKFYMRRILRIWPLYYLIVLISFTIIPILVNNIDSFQNENHFYTRILHLQEAPYYTLLLFLLFLPNIALKLKPGVVGAAQTWSVGVEEQFYIIWPHLFNVVRSRKLLLLILFSIVFINNINQLIYYIDQDFSLMIGVIFEYVPINYMATGAVGAYMLFYHKDLLNRILHLKVLFLLNSILLLYFSFFPLSFFCDKVTFSFIILFQILFITRINFKNTFINKAFEKLGGISYGIYMYHPTVMFLCFTVFNSILPTSISYLYNFSIYISIFLLTYLVSYFSYHYFEKRFMQIKSKKYTKIKSGK